MTLEEYSKEVYGKNSSFPAMTLEELIDSHRRLRSLCIEADEYRQQVQNDAYKVGLAQGLATIKREYITLSDLKNMSMGEIAELINESSED